MSPRNAMDKYGRTALSLVALVLVLLGPGCITEPDSVDDDATNVLVQIVQMLASSEDFQGAEQPVTDLFSDVCFANDDFPPCTVFNDNGVVTMRAIPKDPSNFSASINDVTFERYRVTYIRADGRNVPGVDVPYPFDGAANFTVPVTGGEVERSFVVVRHQAKEESPLREITFNPGAILSVIAQIDFYGHDSAGRSIQTTGYLNITFADFSNEE